MLRTTTEGNANAEEIRSNVPDTEEYVKGKKYLKGSMVKSGDKIYIAKDNVPADVDLDNENYWEIFIDNNDYKTLAAEIGELSDLETESKDNLVSAINEAKNSAVQSDWEQNNGTAKDYIKNRPFYEESSTENLGTTFADWQKSCQNHGESSIVINANVAGG